MTIRILVADDHAVVREGLASVLAYQADFEIAGLAADGNAAVSAYSSQRPDIVLMDLAMPHCGGVEAIRRIREANPAARIIVLTTYDGDEDVYRALEAGAKGYLLKDATAAQLAGAIRNVHAGSVEIPPEVAARLAERAMAGPALSSRETEVLRLVAAGKSNKEIAGGLHISEATVKSHLLSIFEKLGADDRTQAVVIALKRGMLKLV